MTTTTFGDAAGTSADVFVQLYGTKGKSPQQTLPNNGRSFQRAAEDLFELCCDDIGEPQKLRM